MVGHMSKAEGCVFRLNRVAARAVARAILADELVAAPLAERPAALSTFGCKLAVRGLRTAVELRATCSGVETPAGVMLRLVPRDDVQRGLLLALSELEEAPMAREARAEREARAAPAPRPSSSDGDDPPTLPGGAAAPSAAHDRYELGESIGSGGAGTVHRAVAIGPGGFARDVAVKVLHPHLAADPAFRAMVLDEARLGARVHHRNVVAVFDVWRTKDSVALAMEYVPGVTLRHILQALAHRAERLPLGVAARIAVDLLAGLHAAHTSTASDGTPLELVHRDVSPPNVLVGRDGVTRLTDFGVAWARTRLISTQSKTLKGKIGYMAPEQALCERVERRADVWGAGAVLWEMLTGERLFEAPTEILLLRSVLCERVRGAGEVRPDLPEPVAAVCAKALERRLELRYATAADFSAALRAACGRAGIALADDADVAAIVARIAPLGDEERRRAAGSASRTAPTRIDAHEAPPAVTRPTRAAPPATSPPAPPSVPEMILSVAPPAAPAEGRRRRSRGAVLAAAAALVALAMDLRPPPADLATEGLAALGARTDHAALTPAPAPAAQLVASVPTPPPPPIAASASHEDDEDRSARKTRGSRMRRLVERAWPPRAPAADPADPADPSAAPASGSASAAGDEELEALVRALDDPAEPPAPSWF
jgi:serine/threonine-protein kinase